ncbi:ATP-grasp domain-containing protein [Promethearchaeum syntrophicum]|uniref:ATP-grasp domain-containing protein n=1 Tax=Promethearchaeum syntrophicum TaxID=2594042 RepID=A0A5B9DAE3_9ARCH|nr:ATP-grasp domain-containing protein [Candidatus Prometheoarchaeum syntrophicum]QEE16062.1 carbamoyl phosphate synthase-like protein [Candidatus Prometheoarchaeum syntrophicum]
MKNVKVLVFPCGSEIGLEIHRALKYIRYVDLIGGTSVTDHSRVVYDKIIDNIPFVSEKNFIKKINEVIIKERIDFIIPAMDVVCYYLSKFSEKIHCKIVGHSYETNSICYEKKKTYEYLEEVVRTPKLFSNRNEIHDFPVFLKPNIGYGGIGTKIIHNKTELDNIQNLLDNLLIEFLPGKEYTVDCFTDRNGILLFSNVRERVRIKSGISVNTISVKLPKALEIARKINSKIDFCGAWFFQIKETFEKVLCLMEVAPRISGSSSINRLLGINLPLLSLHVTNDENVQITPNSLNTIEIDRAFDVRFIFEYDKIKNIYVDFDDCLMINKKVNYNLVAFLFKCINEKKKIILLTKHEGDLINSLKISRLENIFDKIIHINKNERKIDFISPMNSLFIDDSYSERKEVIEKLGVLSFSPDVIDGLIR